MEPRRVSQGFFPVVMGGDVRVERGGGLAFLAGRQLTVQQGGGQWLVSANHLDVRQGGGAALIAKTARVEQGFVAVLFAWHAQIAPGARVLLRWTPAVTLAAAAGFLAGWGVGRRKRT